MRFQNYPELSKEICGDGPISLKDRILYLWLNTIRNLRWQGTKLDRELFFADRHQKTSSLASPSRALTEAYLYQHLPGLLPPKHINILDIGCGSGRMAQVLADLGYTGTYVGLDIRNRFSFKEVDGLHKEFVQCDVHEFDPKDKKFDLILSISALEHIADDASLIDHLPKMLDSDGIELHFVPAGWALPLYLWHGYRQYTLRDIATKFGEQGTRVIGLGGLYSFLLHFFVITFAEMLLCLQSRIKIPRVYTKLLESALKNDQKLPFLQAMYVVHRTNHSI